MASSVYGVLSLFQGMRYDSVTGLYETPNRELNPETGTWPRADPGGYVNGVNRYRSFEAAPPMLLDPSG